MKITPREISMSCVAGILIVLIGYLVEWRIPKLLENQTIIASFLIAGVIGSLVYGFKPRVDKFFEKYESTNTKYTREELRKHTEYIIEIYKLISDFTFRNENGELTLKFPLEYEKPYSNTSIMKAMERINTGTQRDLTDIKGMKFHDQYRYFDYALQHLEHKKYEDVFQHWVKTNQLIEDFNKSPKFIEMLKIKIRDRIKENFPDFKEITDKKYDDHYYNLDNIVKTLSEEIKLDSENNFDHLIIDRYSSSMCICSKGYWINPQIGSIDESKLNLEKYKLMLKSIADDNEIKEKIKSDLKKHYKIHEEQEKFEKKILHLIKKFEDVGILEGKCEGCS